MEDFEVVLIFGDGEYTLSLPDIDDDIGNHASIAAGTSGTERMDMINQKLTRKTLDNEPWFVRRQDRTSTMEFCNIQCASLGSWGSKGNL